MMVQVGDTSVKHKVSMRTFRRRLLCSFMSLALSGLAHTELEFENPDGVAAMGTTLWKGAPEYMVEEWSMMRLFSFTGPLPVIFLLTIFPLRL